MSGAYSGLTTNTYGSMFRWNIKVFTIYRIAVFIPVDPSGPQTAPSYD